MGPHDAAQAPVVAVAAHEVTRRPIVRVDEVDAAGLTQPTFPVNAALHAELCILGREVLRAAGAVLSSESLSDVLDVSGR